ncbi:hypothetical protein PR048_003420 [Dryococelus australis]|uniref:Uncharacterized protein n=1 Tax=Dryococelus australis TaxID=614101 RepID=A0ABQ9IPH1_9NEOP|nr:hypothetical protein PR048_003420 [Dryococelus australis]
MSICEGSGGEGVSPLLGSNSEKHRFIGGCRTVFHSNGTEVGISLLGAVLLNVARRLSDMLGEVTKSLKLIASPPLNPHTGDGATPRVVSAMAEDGESEILREISLPMSSETAPWRDGRDERGGVAERLACSPPTKANRVKSQAASIPYFRMWESCQTMPLFAGFSRGSPVSPALSFRRCFVLNSITLVVSQDLTVKSPKILTTDSELQCQTLLPDFVIGFPGLPRTMFVYLKMYSIQKRGETANGLHVENLQDFDRKHLSVVCRLCVFQQSFPCSMASKLSGWLAGSNPALSLVGESSIRSPGQDSSKVRSLRHHLSRRADHQRREVKTCNLAKTKMQNTIKKAETRTNPTTQQLRQSRLHLLRQKD